MNPPPSPDVATPTGASETADARALTLHLEVCRMQAELEVLERRIAQYEQAESTGVGPHDPFAERAEDLVQRMVDALYAIGRSEIVESTEASRAAAEDTIAAGRRRAQEILVAARAELAEALTARADAAETADLVDLTQGGGEDEPVVVLAEAIATETVTVLVDRPLPDDDEVGDDVAEPDELEVVQQVEEPDDLVAVLGAEAPEAEEPGVVLEAEEPELDEVAGANLVVTVTDADSVLYPDILVEVGTVAASTEAADTTETVAASAEAADTTETVDTTDTDTTEGELVLDAVEAPVEGVVEQPWLPPTPAPDQPPSLAYPPPVPKGAEGATQRTDEAFDAWLAVAPPQRAVSDDAAPPVELPYDDSTPDHRAWVRPLEGVLALLAVIVLVVVVLLVLI